MSPELSPVLLPCLLSSVLYVNPFETQAALEAIIKNLERENALISSAWYDLTSRLQSNHVVLQRRHDVPKSWLNKQRHLVNGMPSTLSCDLPT